MTSRFALGLAASFLLLIPGCKDPDAGGTGGTAGVALYAFDTTSKKVLVWTDLNALYDNTASPAPTRQITSSLFTKAASLAWGGMCVDGQRGLLYLVSETGDIVRVSNIRAQTGTVANVDVVSFQLASTDRLTSGKFEQASVDPQNDRLCITETGTNGTRIWVVDGASSKLQDASVPLQAIQMNGDTGGTGVAAASGVVYAFFADGSPVGLDALSGPRLRRGNSSAFDPAMVILGGSTTLGIHGSLAFDSANGYLFVARHNTDASSTAQPIQGFRTGQFGGSYNQAPSLSLGSPTEQKDLRVISHAGTKDWLVGLRGQDAGGFDTIYIWKSPTAGTPAKAITVPPSGTVLKGLAVDGNAS